MLWLAVSVRNADGFFPVINGMYPDPGADDCQNLLVPFLSKMHFLVKFL